MQKQLTTRDWILYSLLCLLILLVLLSMYQIDRQWLKLTEMEASMSDQSKEMRELRSAIASGRLSASSVSTSEASGEVSQAFKRAYTATRLPDYAPGDWSVDAFGTNLKTITPLVSTDAYASNIQSYVLESLITRNPDNLEWEGLIAKSWKVSEDGLVINFQLRDDVSFSDGESLTAEDVVFTFDFIMTEAIQAPRGRAYVEKSKAVKANGKYGVVFTFRGQYFEALSLAVGKAVLPKPF
ncbi:MAG: ABC transporter substrate-binding protein, partial [Methylococcaceae bacterium]|nr:ABC transporter substrate-binding protein [Methylococcaceae bacterium]